MAGELFYSEISSTDQYLQTHFTNSQIQNYESNPENFTNLSENNSVMWKLLFAKTGNNFQVSDPSTSKTMNEDAMNHTFFDHINHKPDFQSTISGDFWQENNFLSLSSFYPSSVGLQSFDQERNQQSVTTLISTNFSGEMDNLHHRQNFLEGFTEKDGSFQSKYLNPVKELLNELCCLSTNQHKPSKNRFVRESKQWEERDFATLSRPQSLSSLDFMDLQKRKTKLFSMLEGVERRYRRYRDQIKKVESSFEGIAGVGAASVYSALASKAMSRHFKSLKYEIVNQIQGTEKAMGGKKGTGGSKKGQTLRLRLVDQTVRRQRAFQQINMLQTLPWRPQRGFPEPSVSVLRAWLFEHFLHPYPNDVDKHVLARQTGLSRSQVSNWFINARVRLWKPMIEEIYTKDNKEKDAP